MTGERNENKEIYFLFTLTLLYNSRNSEALEGSSLSSSALQYTTTDILL